ncbi:MAG TPA: hypothetical protein VFQ61_28580 [Polyangiaceae bacterium]|nr:hypothetical protein [Polyangiaceae bacterium]
MNKIGLIISSAIGLLGLASACSVEPGTAEDMASADQSVCANPEGANYSMAGLAAATAKELRRWNTAKDFQVVVKCNYSMAGCQEVVDLTSTGKAQCADGQCKNVQAILDFQKKEASGKIKFPGGATLQSDIFAQRLVANLKAQITCNSKPDNHQADNCPVEQHTLTFLSANPGGCETDYWFRPYKAGTTTPLTYPAQLKNQLITFGSLAGNPYLAFGTSGQDVKIDPGPGTVGGDPSTTGSCPVLTMNGKFSTTDIVGQCCIFNNVQMKFARSTFNASYYLCQ